MGLNFEQVWAALMETRQQMKETDRLFQESKAETERFLRESRAETDRIITKMSRELNQAIGKLGNRFGELIEHLVSPNLMEKFITLGYAFSRTNTRVKYKDVTTGKTLAEVDVLLENGEFVLAVEIKADPSSEDVKDHVKRMETLRAYADVHNDKRKYIGAIAGGIVGTEVKTYALKSGFYVLEQAGDTVRIEEPPRIRSW
jgi:hypothetical protein